MRNERLEQELDKIFQAKRVKYETGWDRFRRQFPLSRRRESSRGMSNLGLAGVVASSFIAGGILTSLGTEFFTLMKTNYPRYSMLFKPNYSIRDHSVVIPKDTIATVQDTTKVTVLNNSYLSNNDTVFGPGSKDIAESNWDKTCMLESGGTVKVIYADQKHFRDTVEYTTPGSVTVSGKNCPTGTIFSVSAYQFVENMPFEN